ncbi:uncharacterized protein DDB_G0285291 [Scaptodrosophila lebanonensis]|uniref:Uncharacterized protein DDB_G0285291 n=1 Tax=Drosophila lebanonensis TaxID=7225 RepID=A0A6J2U5J3_DROLE|nr:uncharacterized protein DDB_G0285291 [Scaptodrosophila lebanonensis]
MYKLVGNSVQTRTAPPQISPQALALCGNGLIFNGQVYPVLVDGVPVPEAVAALKRQQQQQHFNQPQPSGKIVRTQQFRRKHTNPSRPHQQQLHSQQQQQLQQLQLLQQQQIMQQQNLYPNMQQPYSNWSEPIHNRSTVTGGMLLNPQPSTPAQQHFSYGFVPNQGESNAWQGYAMFPNDVSKPFAFGWSSTD